MRAVDLFAGLGGSTSGAEEAGATVLWAGNHWPAAVEWHQRNHPHVEHACQDLHQTDWGSVPEHDLLLASPSCQGHSRARGRDRPHHDAARSTAWAVVSCAEAHRPRAVVVENVPEFLGWVLFPAWRSAMLALGYDMHAQVIDSADLGMAQSRRRVYLSAVRGAPAAALHIVRRSPATARGVVQWESGSWAPANAAQRRSRGLRSLCAATVRRIEDGRRRLGDRFLLPYYGTSKARTVDAPIGALTTRERYAVVDGDRLRMLTVDEQRAFMGFPPDYALPPDRRLATHLLGNAVCPPVMREIVGVLMTRA